GAWRRGVGPLHLAAGGAGADLRARLLTARARRIGPLHAAGRLLGLLRLGCLPLRRLLRLGRLSWRWRRPLLLRQRLIRPARVDRRLRRLRGRGAGLWGGLGLLPGRGRREGAPLARRGRLRRARKRLLRGVGRLIALDQFGRDTARGAWHPF